MAHSERSIHEMLKDAPTMNENPSAIHSGTTQTNIRLNPPNTLPLRNTTIGPITSSASPLSPSQNSDSFLKNGSSKIDSIKNWSISTYKCTRQLMLEKFGKTARTVDSELETQIEQLRDTQRKYLSILRLSRAFSANFQQCVSIQLLLSEQFSDLAQKSPELQEEFLYNAETQKNLTKNGEILLGAMNFFVSSVNTLCNKTFEDTLLTIRQYESARIEFDAYRMDLELTKTPDPTSPSGEEALKNFNKYRDQYEKLRGDVEIKMQFLDENRIKVMHKQLILLHNAMSAYFSGNAEALESTLKQFSIKSPNSATSSWLEQ